jgi:hypothetical protein
MLARIFIAIVLGVSFLGWVLYRLLIKKDLKKHLTEFYFGLFFIGIWVLIYWLITKD